MFPERYVISRMGFILAKLVIFVEESIFNCIFVEKNNKTSIMNNFSDLIKNRRSMRKFTDEELSQDQVVTLLKAALMSPSSKRSNP